LRRGVGGRVFMGLWGGRRERLGSLEKGENRYKKGPTYWKKENEESWRKVGGNAAGVKGRLSLIDVFRKECMEENVFVPVRIRQNHIIEIERGGCRLSNLFITGGPFA